MTIENEEKLLKSLGVFVLLVFVPANFILKNDNVKLAIIVPLTLLFSILYFRKYARDKRDGKDLSQYKRLLFFIGISFLIFIIFLFFPMK